MERKFDLRDFIEWSKIADMHGCDGCGCYCCQAVEYFLERFANELGGSSTQSPT